jgi:hypothetical protein
LECHVIDHPLCAPGGVAEAVKARQACISCSDHVKREPWTQAVTVERSSDFPGLTPGYYVVVIGSGGPRQTAELVRRAKRAGLPAYIRFVQATLFSCGE